MRIREQLMFARLLPRIPPMKICRRVMPQNIKLPSCWKVLWQAVPPLLAVGAIRAP
jgi:hypothetical protein